MIFFHITLHPAVLIYDFHIVIILSRVNKNQFNDLFPAGLLAQLVDNLPVILS